MRSVPWKIIVVTEEEHKMLPGPAVPRRGLLGFPSPMLGPKSFPLQAENPLEINDFTQFLQASKTSILFFLLFLFAGCCPHLPEHTAPGERFCSGIGFDISPWHYQMAQGQVLQAAAAQGVHSGAAPTGSAVAGVTPSLSHDVYLT